MAIVEMFNGLEDEESLRLRNWTSRMKLDLHLPPLYQFYEVANDGHSLVRYNTFWVELNSL